MAIETAEQYKSQYYLRTADIESRFSNGLSLEDRWQREADFALDSAGQKFEKGDKILDLACGVGGHADVMRKKTGVDIDALDAASTYIEQARSREQIRRQSDSTRGKIDFIVGPMEGVKELTPSAGQYKLITNLGSSFMFGTKKETYEKACRDFFETLAPGGKLVLQFRQRRGTADPAKREEWREKLGVRMAKKKSEGPNGAFGKPHPEGHEIDVMEDAQRGDALYWYDEEDASDGPDGVRRLKFSRAYIDPEGTEHLLGPAEFLDYMDMDPKVYAVLKDMLERAGFTNIELKTEPLSPDGCVHMVVVVATREF